MDKELFQISVDLLLILRVLGGFVWGACFAIFLQKHRYGQFLVRERTWITVVIGIGIDFLIAYRADWDTTLLVVCVSSIGIIIRSLYNESNEAQINENSYKLKWALMDGNALAGDIISQLTKILTDEQLSQTVSVKINKTLAIAHQIKLLLTDARRGEYSQKNGKVPN